MSLKVFHVLFILFATALCVLCAVWSYVNETATAFGVISAVCAIALLIYGVWFLKKSKTIIT